MILINTLVIGGCVLAGTQVYDKVIAVKNRKGVTFLDKLEPQAYVRRWRQAKEKKRKEKKEGDWFSVPAILRFGKDKRRKNLEALSAEENTPEITEAEQRINHYFAVSLGSLGIAIAGSLIYPPLHVLSLPTLIYSALPIYKNAYTAIFKEKRVSVDILYATTFSIIVLGQNFVLGNMNICFFFLSEKVLVMARERFKKNLRQLFGELPTTVRVVDRSRGVEVEKTLESVQIGDLIVLEAGEMIPIDGIIMEGMASIDQHVLTGESQPVEKEKTERVFASTVVLSGRIYVEVEQAGEQTIVAQIGHILENTTEFKASKHFWAEMATDKSVVPMFTLAGLSVPFIGSYGAGAIISAHPQRRMITSAPLSVLTFLNLASQQGILIKDGRTLELFSQVDTIVFDKTGTLTLAQPHVAQIHPCNGHTEQSLLSIAAAAESKQSHPIAKAIRQAAEEHQLIVPEIDEAQYQIGYGLTVTIDEQLIQIGSVRFIEKEGIQIPPQIGTRIDEVQQQGDSIVLVAIDHQLAGAIELHATIRPEAQKMIQMLQQQNLSLFIISGDHEQPTKKLAQALGIVGAVREPPLQTAARTKSRFDCRIARSGQIRLFRWGWDQ